LTSVVEICTNSIAMPSNVIEKCVGELNARDLTISLAESATAGRMASEFALVKESGKCLIGGLVCYDANVKVSVLGVDEDLIDKFTAESAEVTKAMADNLPKLFDSSIYAAVTGLASPGGSETDEKPVGTMFLHVKLPDGQIATCQTFEGTPEDVVLQTIDRACELITESLQATTK
jgi:nicotinamide-nucleotide amidase